MKDILVICAMWLLPAYLVLRLNAIGILWGSIVMWISFVLTCMMALQSELGLKALPGLYGAVMIGWLVGLTYCSLVFCVKKLAMRIRRKEPNKISHGIVANAPNREN